MILAHAGYMAGQGWTVEVHSSKVDSVFPIPEGIKIIVIGSRSKLGTLFYAVKNRFNADFVIADIIPVVCFLAPRNLRTLIYFAQDYDEAYYKAAWQKFIIRTLYFLGLTVLRVQAIAVAEHLTNLLRRRFMARVSTVENGVETDIFFPDPLPELLTSKDRHRAVLLLSRSDARKGFDLGCQIFSEVTERLGADNLEVWTVGERADHVFKGLAHRDFGYVEPTRLRQILSSADVFLYHTRHEGFPLMALEALACGCPMAASSAVSVVRPGQEALVSAVGDISLASDHVVRILMEPEEARRLSQEGQAFALRHSLTQSSARFVKELLRLD